jgi:hypothetical protein
MKWNEMKLDTTEETYLVWYNNIKFVIIFNSFVIILQQCCDFLHKPSSLSTSEKLLTHQPVFTM